MVLDNCMKAFVGNHIMVVNPIFRKDYSHVFPMLFFFHMIAIRVNFSSLRKHCACINNAPPKSAR